MDGVVNPDCQGDIMLPYTIEAKQTMYGSQGVLRHLLAFPVVNVNGKLQQPKRGRMTKDSDPLGMKVWVTAVGKGNMEWVVEEGSHRYQL